ncbi:hypothetical protein LEP1GSC073_1666 [Leptospira noguchii str. Cascata]|nr:hypothetical protein LEP1GSC073_1666 [Leptospira noguchii str. Cascata]
MRWIVLVKMDQKANDRGISFDFLVNGFQLKYHTIRIQNS